MTPATPLFFDRVAYEAMVSYESLVAEFSIPQSKLEEECRENVWRKVSSKFTKWRNAAPHLELDEDVVEAIEGGAHDEEGKRYDLLRRWKQKFAFQGTNEKLIRCLLAAGRADLAEVAALEILGEKREKYWVRKETLLDTERRSCIDH